LIVTILLGLILLFIILVAFSQMGRKIREEIQRYCWKCGKKIDPKAVKCPHCGVSTTRRDAQPPELLEILRLRKKKKRKVFVYCSHCGKEIDAEEDVCPKCGVEILKKSDCCIIATLTLPSDSKDLEYLRSFRDEVLKQSWFGRFLIWLYYSLSPPLALLICLSDRIKRLVRERFVYKWIEICKKWDKQKEKCR
jgi:predicted RNA-binding Zn-ribbon protein involved in translation (DUF1610 family)